MATAITPRMDLAPLAERVPCSIEEASWVLLELLAEGHWARDLGTLSQGEIDHAWHRAWHRMDSAGVPV